MGKIITVDFRNDTLFAFERDDGIYVALKPIVESMGLSWQPQHRRVRQDAVLAEGIIMMVIPSPGGGAQETLCLKLEMVNGWLFSIDDTRIKDDEVREKVLTYKRECYRVLFEHFYGKNEREGKTEIGTDPRADEPLTVRRQLVTEARQSFDVQSARELWFKLGLPTVPSMFADPRQSELFTYQAIKKPEPSDKEAA